MPNRLDFTITAADTGQRLDRFLTQQLPDFSRSAVQRLLKAVRCYWTESLREKTKDCAKAK